ncbi:hypothetical protein GQ43DRAFT_454384 [Delitschia confertaspora ATCC 74209]|uniref:Uncharacterized protein n=1 Tax=Delitschia confertaspora ATCC 74209 TaxID=1513339 RepID=A0A9P4JUC3_9PLEO|nr:hypothetical protein GQ43DRAFT_454384 [Delitschia confertaspora ATCC 74209]
MKLLTILSTLAATALAAESDSSSSSSSTSTTPTSASSSVSSSSSPSSTPEEPTPVGKIWSPKWLPTSLPSTLTTACHARATHTASIYSLGEIYPTLSDFAPQLKVFYNKQHYPGSWDGVDKHGNERELMKMSMEDLPFGVREWMKKEGTQRHYSVHPEEGGTVFFAPGAMYPLLPLWVGDEVGEELGAECEGIFEDLENYSATPEDGKVIARVEHRSTGKNEVEVVVEAMLVKKKAEEQKKDEL